MKIRESKSDITVNIITIGCTYPSLVRKKFVVKKKIGDLKKLKMIKPVYLGLSS